MYFPWRCCSPEHKTVLTTVQIRKRKGVNLKGAAIFELFSRKNEALLIWRYALKYFLFSNLSTGIIDSNITINLGHLFVLDL